MMLKKIWLIFAQTVALALALWLILNTFRPQWLPNRLSRASNDTVVIKQQVNATPQDNTQGVQISYRYAASKATPATVNIYTQKHGDASSAASTPPNKNNRSSLGSGVIVSDNGYIITNYHVIEAADEISIALQDDRHFNARVIGTDPETDLAVLRIDAPNLQPIVFGDAKSIQTGDIVLAIGNPYGVGQTVTMGIVSALGRTRLGINTYENFIQSDAAINPGNSGGALVDTQGRLLGINTAIFSKEKGAQGIGFAIPETTIRSVLAQIVQDGSVTRGWVGVGTQDITPELAQRFNLPQKEGVIVASTIIDGPAARAGILPGDIIVSVNKTPAKHTQTILNQIATLQPGDTADIVILRNKNIREITLTVSKRPSPKLKRMGDMPAGAEEGD